MAINIGIRCFLSFSITLFSFISYSQQHLSLKEAVSIAGKNYGTLKAKSNYTRASLAVVEQAKKENLPDFGVSTQQNFGTINGQNGAIFGLRGLVLLLVALLGKAKLERSIWFVVPG